jgi:hypothetical protein
MEDDEQGSLEDAACLLLFASSPPAKAASPDTAADPACSDDDEPDADLPDTNRLVDLLRGSDVHDVHDAPKLCGRPPKYDEMTHWCVTLKRALIAHNVVKPLSLGDAIALVNDPAYNAAVTAPLVPSTLRKRVPALYGVRWVDIGTEKDKGIVHDNVSVDIASAVEKMIRKPQPRENVALGHSSISVPVGSAM